MYTSLLICHDVFHATSLRKICASEYLTLTDLHFHGLAGVLHEPRQLDSVPEDRVVRDLVPHDASRAGAGVHAHPDLDPGGPIQ